MNKFNSLKEKKSALMFFIASGLFTISFLISVSSGSLNYILMIPAFFTFLSGLVQWKNYKKLKEKDGK